MRRIILMALLAAGAGGCVAYKPLPLDDHITLASSVHHITVDSKEMPFPLLATRRFDPSDGLDMTETAMLAVAENSALKLARGDARVAHAQAFAAGLLPDPQVHLSQDFPRTSGPGIGSAYSTGISYDVGALIPHGAASRAASAESRRVDLTLLWQEWQVVAQARVLFSRAVSNDHMAKLLAENRRLQEEYHDRVRAALTAGNITADAAAPAVAAWQDAVRQEYDLNRRRQANRRELNALLDLAPDISLELVDGATPAAPADEQVYKALDDLPRRRPDLMALKAGYEGQDTRFRQAVLSQFPPFNLAFNLSRDTSNVTTAGYALSLSLPLLNGNRGVARVEKATRARLHDEYTVRLNEAWAQVKGARADMAAAAVQLKDAESALPALKQAAADGKRALAEGNIDLGTYAALENARIMKEVEVENLRQALLEGRIALLTLLGGDLADAS